MAISYLDNLNIKKKAPNVERDLFATIADMVAWSENYLPNVFECNVEDTGKRYRYNASNTVDPVLGKWREVTGGDTDLTNYYTKTEIDETVVKPVKELAEQNETNIGTMDDLAVSTWTDLVSAINALYNSFLQSIVYTTKEVDDKTVKVMRFTYRDGTSTDVDVTAIITGSKISELADVNINDAVDGQAIVYDYASRMFKNKDLGFSEFLQTAKDYTDEQIAESEKSSAIAADEKPVYNAETKEITYKQNGETKTTEDISTWFYYKSNDTVIQTRWISDVEFTIDLSNINLENYVKKLDVTDTYTGDVSEDKTKIASIACLDSLKGVIATALADKLNITDVVDNLTSTSTEFPLSANQGKVLDEKISDLADVVDEKLAIQQDVENAGKFVKVASDGKLTFAAGASSAENVSYENDNYPLQTNVKKALDAIWAKIDYVKPEITAFTVSPATTVYEKGSTVDSLTFAWTYNKNVTAQSLTDVTLTDETDRSGTYGSLSTTKTFELSCSDGQNTAKKSITIAFRDKIYYGSASIPDEYDSAFILGLSKKDFATSKKGSFTMTVASGEYGFIAFPSSFGTLSSVYIGGFETTVESCGSISFTNASGGVTTYSIYRTGRSGLGTITMEIK